ncbi:MAG: DUF2892 domain-containing protein [Bdellovibrionaceae bacterium]|nr:DUF2892 domain-containing protein [Pseudobdellovibrionaceae bacterium]
MLCNTAQWDRLLRFVFSIVILVYAIAGGPFWFYAVGIYFLVSAAWGLCPLYAYFKIGTLR